MSFSAETKKAFVPFLFLVCFVSLQKAVAATIAPNVLPTNGQVVAGNATINSTTTANSATLNVNQTSQRAVINWDSFNVGKNATVNFNQPNSNAVTLNRVTSGSASVIDGAIKANGQVILVNSNGVTFGKGAEVNAAAVVASTLNIADKEFMEGNATFKDDGSGVGSKAGKIVNKGTIRTNQADNASGEGGFIALLAPEVRNQGYLLAQKGGTVAIGSGSHITLNIQGQSLVAIKVEEGVYNGLISNKHIIEAPGGLVVLATSAANQLMAGVIKNTGRISASAAINNGGVIELVAKNVTQAGTMASNSQTQAGGQINLVGQEITVAKNSSTTATGATGGGQVNIGLANTPVSGGNQVNSKTPQEIKANADAAANSKQLANTVTINENALIDTSATQLGNGGTMAIWSQVQTTVAGILKSLGGALSGNGGFIETSSKGSVSLAPTANINTSANNPTGKVGTWLLDPIDLTIDASTATLIAQILTSSNVTIAVTSNTNTCPMGACTQNGAANLTIASGADILKAGNAYTTLTLSSDGIFNLNANISGQNLDVIIQSSIAYLNVGSSINASKVTVQAQTIHGAGTIQTNNYLNPANLGSLGNAIELLAQAIYVSGRLSASTTTGVAGNIKLEATTITLRPEALLEANGDAGGLITVAANDSIYNSARLQANGGNGRGGTITLTAANDQYFTDATLLANGTTDGGAISITTQVGDVNLANSIIQTNGSAGRGGSIGLSATHSTQIASSNISANGYSQGGTIKIGNDASNGSLPFSLVTSIDEHSIIHAAQLDSNPANQQGGFIETSGHTLNLLSSINAGRGGMWLVDPYSLTITGAQNVNGSSATNAYTGVGIASLASSTLNAALTISAVTITNSSGDITINGAISGVNSLTIIASAGNIQINAPIELTGLGSSIVLKASGYISTYGASTYRTNGGDIIFWSNTANVTSIAATNAKFIYIDSGTRVLTNGGSIYLAGGLSSTGLNVTANGNFYPVGYAFAGSQTVVSGDSGYVGASSGIFIGPNAGQGQAISLKSDGGNIVISGQTTLTNMPGITTQATLLIDSGTGTISITGKAHNGHGVELAYGSATANIVISSASTSTNAIQISGTTDGGNNYMGFWATNGALASTPGVLIQATGLNGGITISGVNTSSGAGVLLSNIDILANSGPITISASSLTTQSQPVFVGGCVGSSIPCASFIVDGNTYLPIMNSSSNVFIKADAWSAGSYGWGGQLTINTAGVLTVAPVTASAWNGSTFNWSGTNSITGGLKTFTADANSFIGVANKLVVKNIAGITIGLSNSTSPVTISQDLSPFGVVSVYGSIVNINAAMSSLSGNLLLQSNSGDININSNIGWGAGTSVTLTSYANIFVNSRLASTSGILNIVYGRQYSNGCTTSSSGVCSAFLVKGNIAMDSSSTLYIQMGSSPLLNHQYTIITSLGVQGDTSGTTLQGINTVGLAGYYAIGSDIDANETSNWNGGVGFTPIGGTASNIFGNASDAYIQGLGNRIINLTINATTGQYIGLVARLGPYAQINNLGLAGGLIKTRTNATLSMGSFTGYVGSWSTVGLTGNFSSAAVAYEPATAPTTYVYIGGLAGDTNQALKPQLKNNAFTGSINVTIPGNASNAIISVGGLLGRLVQNPLSDSFSNGSITVADFNGAGVYVGGLVGQWWGASASQISNVYSNSTITLGNHAGARAAAVGGLVGNGSNSNCTANTNLCGTITNGYAVGSIVAGTNWYSGGIMGYLSSPGVDANPYKYSSVYSSVAITNPTAGNIGGFIGYINEAPNATWSAFGQPIFINSYWNSDLQSNAIGQNISSTSTTGLTALTGSQMQSQASYSGFNFSAPWSISAIGNSGLPTLNIYSPLKSFSNLYVLLVEGSSSYGQSPNFTYGIYTSAEGVSPVSLDISNLVSGSVAWSGSVPTASSPVGSYSMQYASGLVISSDSYNLVAGNRVNWTVNPAPLGIKVTATYASGNVFTPSNSVIATSGLVAGQSITSITAYSNLVGPGNYVTAITGAGGFVASNYILYSGSDSGSAGVLNGSIYAGIVSGSNNIGGTNIVVLNKANLSVTATPSLSGNSYNGTAYSGTYTTNALGFDQSAMTITGVATGINAGIYTSNLTVAGSVLSNYNTPVITNANLVIHRIPLVVKALSLRRQEGAVFSGGNGFTVEGLLSIDTLASLNGVVTYSGSSQGARSAGTYEIIPGGLSSQNYAITFVSGTLVLTPSPVVIPLVISPPLAVIAAIPAPAATPRMTLVIAAPTGSVEGGAPAPAHSAPPAVAGEGGLSSSGANLAAPAPPAASASKGASGAASGSSSSAASAPSAAASSSAKPVDGRSNAEGKASDSGGKSSSSKSERVSKYEARKLARGKGDSDKSESRRASSGNAAGSKYAGKYANGARSGEKGSAASDGSSKKDGAIASAKTAPPREGKYSNIANAVANAPMNRASFAQPQLSASGLPPIQGIPHEVLTPTVLRGGDSLSQSYDDVPSIRNSGVANVGRSKTTENYHESLESVNLMSTLNLFIIH